MEAIQYCGRIAAVLWKDSCSTAGGYHQYMWGIASALWRDSISTVGDSISTVEAIQYCGGIASVHVEG